VNRSTLFAALGCALLLFSMLGCGTTRELQSIQISSSNTSESITGVISLGVNAPVVGPVQLYVWGNYSNGKSQILNGTGVQYQISIDPDEPYAVDPGSGDLYPLSAPPETVELSAVGLLTAVDPVACSWQNVAASTSTTPAFAAVGEYIVTATTQGMTTPPVYVAMASAPGFESPSNPQALCGPQPSSP